MPATYVKEFNGYVADVPRLWFKRCDGRVFYFDELTNATVSPQVNYTEINAGWSLYPVAYLPGQSTFEMSITSGKFEADLFVMTNATEFATNAAYAMPITEFLLPDASKQVILDKTPAEGSIRITWPKASDSDTGYMDVSTSNTPGEGEVLLDTNSSGKSRLTFHTGDIPANTYVQVSYEYTVTAQEAKIDNRSSARGEAVMKYPVYGSGENCTDAAIIGYVIVRVFNARVTAQPGFDASYKNANTFQFTLAAMDAKRTDNAVYSIAYVEGA